jgi:hypothetical protein
MYTSIVEHLSHHHQYEDERLHHHHHHLHRQQVLGQEDLSGEDGGNTERSEQEIKRKHSGQEGEQKVNAVLTCV